MHFIRDIIARLRETADTRRMPMHDDDMLSVFRANRVIQRCKVITERHGVGSPWLIQQTVGGHIRVAVVTLRDHVPQPMRPVLIIAGRLSIATIPIPVSVCATRVMFPSLTAGRAV